MTVPAFSGVLTSVVVPLRDDLGIAHRDLTVAIQHLVRAGGQVTGVVVNDWPGEVEAFSADERLRVIDVAVGAVRDGFTVITGVLADSVDEIVSAIDEAAEHHAAAAIILVPAEGRLWSDDDAALALYRDIAARSRLPLIVRQGDAGDPGRLGLEALATVAALDGVVAVELDTADPAQFALELERVRGSVQVLSGLQTTALADSLAAGADGAVLSIANLVPKQWGAYVAAAQAGSIGSDGGWGPNADALLAGVSASGSETAWIKQALVLLGQNPNALMRAGGQSPAAAEVVTEALTTAGLIA